MKNQMQNRQVHNRQVHKRQVRGPGARALIAAVFCFIAAGMLAPGQNAQAAQKAQAGAVESRIINGKNVRQGKYPWMVALLSSAVRDADDAQFCGGTLIDRQWVLTAAHCVTGAEPSNIQIAVNQVNLNSSRLVRIPVAEIIAHATFSRLGYRDVALLRLARRVPRSVPTVDLINRGANLRVGTAVSAMGWGITETGRSSSRLKEVGLQIASRRLCERLGTRFFPDHELCVVSQRRNKSACRGDSGGPVISRDRNGKLIQVGLTSWGRGNCDTGFASVYTRLSGLVPWIQRQIQERSVPGETVDLSTVILPYCVGTDCVFDATYASNSYRPSITRYIWRTEDGGALSGSDENIFRHKFSRAGDYKVTLTLRFSNGRSARKEITVPVTRSAAATPDRFKITESYAPFLAGDSAAAFIYAGGGQGAYFYGGRADFRLRGPSGTDFDMGLFKFNFTTDRWELLQSAVLPGSNERITRSLLKGYYYLLVRSFSGAGTALVTNTVWRSRRDVCVLRSFLACRAQR